MLIDAYKIPKIFLHFSNIQQNKTMQVTDDKHCTQTPYTLSLINWQGHSHRCKIQISEQSIT